MALVLDTDHLTILQQESQPTCARLLARIDQHPEEILAVTIISFQEQVQGWMAFLNQARTAAKILLAYEKLQQVLDYFCKARVLQFDQAALNQFEKLRKQGIRVGTMDLRMAAIVQTNDCKLLSSNLKDFRKVPGLDVSDWLH